LNGAIDAEAIGICFEWIKAFTTPHLLDEMGGKYTGWGFGPYDTVVPLWFWDVFVCF
jgi:hypothetical protein